MNRSICSVMVATSVLAGGAALVGTQARAACNNQGCGVATGTMFVTCDLSGGGQVTVQCLGGVCGARKTCSKCDQLNGTLVVGCGCVCVDCTNCLGEPG